MKRKVIFNLREEDIRKVETIAQQKEQTRSQAMRDILEKVKT